MFSPNLYLQNFNNNLRMFLNFSSNNFDPEASSFTPMSILNKDSEPDASPITGNVGPIGSGSPKRIYCPLQESYLGQSFSSEVKGTTRYVRIDNVPQCLAHNYLDLGDALHVVSVSYISIHVPANQQYRAISWEASSRLASFHNQWVLFRTTSNFSTFVSQRTTCSSSLSPPCVFLVILSTSASTVCMQPTQGALPLLPTMAKSNSRCPTRHQSRLLVRRTKSVTLLRMPASLAASAPWLRWQMLLSQHFAWSTTTSKTLSASVPLVATTM